MKKILFFAFAAIVAFASCGEDPKETPQDIDPDLSFSVINKPVTVGWEADSYAEISVRGNVEWSAEITSGTGAVLESGSESGTGNGTVIAVFAENEEDGPREVKIAISTTAKVATKSFGVTVTQNGQVVVVPDYYVRVDRNLTDWSGEYLIVYEAQGIAQSNNTYGFTTVLAYDGSANPPLDAAGNVYPLSAVKPGANPDLAALFGATVDKTATSITVTGGKIEANEANAKCRLTVEKVTGGYSIKTTSGYYIGGGGDPVGGGSYAGTTFNEASHVNNFAIGDATSATSTLTYYNSAIITSTTAGANNTVRVNGNTGRFGFWAPALQQHVAMYKLNLDESEYVPEAASFSVTTTPLTAGYQADSEANIPVRGNVAWSAAITSGTGATLKSGSESGTGNGTVTVVFTENGSYDPHDVKVTVSTTADVATKSYEVTVTQSGKPKPAVGEYKRVNANLIDWSGEYLIVYEGQAASAAGTYAATTVLAFNGSAATLDGPGNLLVLSPTTPGTNADLATITGGTVTRTATDITVTGGMIEGTEALNNARFIISAVDGGGYSIKTVGGTYIGGGGTSGTLSASATFDAGKHVHNISVGNATVAGNAAVTFHNCANIVSTASGNNALRVHAGNGRFGYWTTALQYPVALYKLGLEDSEYETAPSFTVTTTPLTAGYQADSKANISVSGNVAWSAAIISGSGATLQSGSESGTGGGTVTVVFGENTSYDPHDVKVTISTTADVATKSYEVTITQSGKPEPATSKYVRVNEAPADWSGEYLIVFEDAAGTAGYKAIFMGSYNGTTTSGAGLDGPLNALDVTIGSGEILANEIIKANAFTIAAVAGGYSVKSASGYYIGMAEEKNVVSPATEFVAATHTTTIELSTDGAKNAVMKVGSYTRTMRFNATAASRRFCYFTGQQPVALYKLVE